MNKVLRAKVCARMCEKGGKEKNMGEIKSMAVIGCPECGSKWVLTRLRTKSRICRKCGFEWYIENGEIVEIKKTKQFPCPECGSMWVVTRTKTQTRLCRKCGYRWYINEQ